MTINKNEWELINAELHEFKAAEAEMGLGLEDGEGMINVKLSRRTNDIILAALGYLRETREMYEGEDE